MTEAQRAILLCGIAAGIVAVIMLVRWIIDKAMYEYNEYTGKRELKSKIKADSERFAREHKKYKEGQRVSQLSNNKYGIQKQNPRTFLPNEDMGDEMLVVTVMQIGEFNGRYAIKFKSDTYGDEVSLFVDEETYKKAKIDAIGMLCYNYKHSVFYYFDQYPDVTEIIGEQINNI